MILKSLDKKSINNIKFARINLNSAIEISKKNNPDLIIAKLEYEQSKKDKTSAKSDLSTNSKFIF